ncbi:MAG TPA: c-type cytochrome biogenesis protein CcsB [Mycobacteriales bacterium]|nr:c-type cytochrome biogenesis protein CcsB [Mycobacteriales bacterium]
MPDEILGELSDALLVVTVIGYALAMLGFAADSAINRARRAVPAAADAEPAALLATGAVRATPLDPRGLPADPGLAGADTPPPGSVTPFRARAATIAMGLTAGAALIHVASVVLRGFAAGRVPWGNMYEFSSAVALTAVVAFLVLVARGTVDRRLGAFVMVPVVLYLGLAATVLYTPAGPLVPALDSYWIKIHVAAAIVASGAFLLSGVLAVLYLLRSRHDERADPAAAGWSLGAALPSAVALDRASYAVIAFAFPIWTFAVIAGAIWAEAAWGRYWGWDPKETWSFITWVLYAGYLHARSTAGWKGRKAAWVAVAAAIALIIDYYVVNIFVVGLHSYA